MESKPRKLSKGAILLLTFLALFLCVIGVAWPQGEGSGKLFGLVTVPGKVLPEISMAAERLPIEVPFIGELPPG